MKKISDEDKEMFKTMAEDCKKSSGASDDDVNKMMDGNIPDTKPSKCMATCIAKQFSMVSSNSCVWIEGSGRFPGLDLMHSFNWFSILTFCFHFFLVQFKDNGSGKTEVCGSCMKKMAEMNGANEEKMKIGNEIIDKCEKVTNDDE